MKRKADRGANGSNGSKWIRPEKRRRIYERDGWRCVWCQKAVGCTPLGMRTDATLDHVLGREQGGTNDAHNLITACVGCNSRRGDDTAVRFAMLWWAHDPHGPVFVLYRVLRACLTPLPPKRVPQKRESDQKEG